MTQRPDLFQLDRNHPLAKGLVFAGLGFGPGSGALFDLSLHKKHGTLTYMDPSTDWVFVPELGRWGLDFDGSDDKVDTLAPIDTASLSMAFWVKPNSTSTQAYIMDRTTGVNGRSCIIGYQTGYFNFFGTSSYPTGTAADTQIAATTSWQHLVMQTDGTKVQGFLNGTLVVDVTGSWTTTAGGLRRISGYGTSRPFGGRISDYIQYDRLLSSNEIADLADPSNVYLSGLIAGRPRRRYFLPSSPSGFKAAWLARQTKIIGGGVS